MKILKINSLLLIAINLFFISAAIAHPTGNMITVGENVLWSYINPLNDSNHKACVMVWKKGSEPKVLIQSEHTASDFMLYNQKEDIYIIERMFSENTADFMVRVLKTKVDGKTAIIWDWFNDDFRIGEGGFFMLTDQ